MSSAIASFPLRLDPPRFQPIPIVEDTLLRVNGCLVVLNESPAEHFLLPYRTEPLTPWWPLYVTGSNQALWSSVTTGLRTAISSHRVSRTAPSTTLSTSSISTSGPTPIRSSPRGAPSRSSTGSTTVGKTTSTTWHSTCSWRGVRRNAFRRFFNSFTSSLSQTGTFAMCRLSLPATRDHTILDDRVITRVGISCFRLVLSAITSLPRCLPPLPSRI